MAWACLVPYFSSIYCKCIHRLKHFCCRSRSCRLAMGLYVSHYQLLHLFLTHTIISTDGMFAILIPVSLSPLIITLFWAENKAKALGLVKVHGRSPSAGPKDDSDSSIARKAWFFAEQLDLVGLILLGAAVALILLPLTLSQTAKSGWKNGRSFGLKSIDSGLHDAYSVHHCNARYWFCSALRLCFMGFPICKASCYCSEILKKQECIGGCLDWFLRFRQSTNPSLLYFRLFTPLDDIGLFLPHKHLLMVLCGRGQTLVRDHLSLIYNHGSYIKTVGQYLTLTTSRPPRLSL